MEFSEFIFDLNLLKTIKNRLKRGYIFARDPHGCDVARKATWQSHTDPRECLRGTEVTRGMHIYIYSNIRVIVYISIPIIGITLTLYIGVPYIPDESLLFLPYGTKFHSSILFQATWIKREASDRTHADHRALMQWTRGPPDHRSTHVC